MEYKNEPFSEFLCTKVQKTQTVFQINFVILQKVLKYIYNYIQRIPDKSLMSFNEMQCTSANSRPLGRRGAESGGLEMYLIQNM